MYDTWTATELYGLSSLFMLWWVSSEHSVPLQISKTCKFYTQCCFASGSNERSIYTTVQLCFCVCVSGSIITIARMKCLINMIIILLSYEFICFSSAWYGAFFCKALMQEIAFHSCSAFDHEHCQKKKISFTEISNKSKNFKNMSKTEMMIARKFSETKKKYKIFYATELLLFM